MAARHGGQPTYRLSVELVDGDMVLDRWERSIGFRDIRLDTEPDGLGAPFTIVVGGQPVFVRGVNWVPDDLFVSALTPQRYRARLSEAKAAGATLVRVWGGGIYEDDAFYDACDELGLMVWQDFLFACAAYPEEEPHRSEVEEEAREAVTRLMPHPSLVLWNGNNENLWGWFDWDWQPRLVGRTWGRGYYLDLLPRVVAETDPTRPYWPGSPWSGGFGRHPNDDAYGLVHIWDVWNTRDYTDYRRRVPRFVAEFGYQAPPTWATLARAVHDDPLAPGSPGMLHHQKADDGNGKLARGLSAHFAEPASFEDWHLLTQMNQARAVQTGVEHFRSHRGRCMGTIWWQLNDCWPVTSWSVIDGDGRRKPAWYALRAAYAPCLVTIQPRGEGLAVVLVNDSPHEWSGSLVVARRSVTGLLREEQSWPVAVAAYGASTIPLPARLAQPDDTRTEVLVADVGDRRAWWWFERDLDLDLPAPVLSAVATATERGYRVDVSARTLVRDLCLFTDRLAPDAVVDDMLVSLLPGESARFDVRTASDLDVGALTSAPVLRCLGDGAGGGLVNPEC
ncbi:MAG TPA: hypothetical protein VHM65_02600 [Candidatus Lustribacter sp.]|nr:hypothetical protein [Candidatus Lustribacter sp.]